MSSSGKYRDNVIPESLLPRLREFIAGATFGKVTSPYDGVIYPGICLEVPKWIEIAITEAIASCIDCDYRDVKIRDQFWRVTTESTPPAPHGAHNDSIHAPMSAFYYANEKPDEVFAGTSLVSHKETGMSRQPKTVAELDVWSRDTNNYDAWSIDEIIFWEPNRLAVYEADRMHRAEPVGGWGKGPEDGRLVLITFFSC